MRLSHSGYVEHIRADAARLATVAARGLDAAVPSCPGWTVGDVEWWVVLDATVSGRSPSMYRWLCGHGPRDEIVVDGDATAVRHLDARMRLATQ